MDNLTHSLVGAALAHLALPEDARPHRRLFLAAGVVAANLPDIDLAYVGITPAPLGYLLHHRGHTHTLLGLLAQGALLALLCRAVPPIWRRVAGHGSRMGALVAAGLITHLLLDAGNSYGVHPFHPFDSRWYYGDAVFILEPWLWVLLGVPVAWNVAGRVARAALFGLLALLPVPMTVAGVILGGPVAVLATAGVALAWWSRSLSFRTRAMAALGLALGFVAGLFALSAVAEARTTALVAPHVRGEIVDTILNPNPADPLCWMVIAIEKREAAGEYVFHRGTLSLVPGWRPPTACASHRFTRRNEPGDVPSWHQPLPQSLGRLRGLGRGDCRVRAWLQFGRAPVLSDGRIYDLRFDNGTRDNFTAMNLHADSQAGDCPPHLTRWAMPRADLVDASP
jgi:inner membrane protein